MIKRKRKRKNPYLADVGYHVTDSSNLQSILDNGFERSGADGYIFRQDLYAIAWYFFNGYSPNYFLDLADIKKLKNEMKGYLSQFDLLLKVDVSNYDLQPDYNQLLIDYDFEIFDSVGDINSGLPMRGSGIKNQKLYLALREEDLSYKTYKDLKSLFFKYGERFNNGTFKPDWYRRIPLKTIKNNDEIKEELIYFTDTFCVNKDIPASKILEFYTIEH